ncbi:MAG: rRNA maturation RNase YbeY [Coriobacteriia bacterium]|nr:rRNA maturation RNase YbeY [Coriobacteriia bacterium]
MPDQSYTFTADELGLGNRQYELQVFVAQQVSQNIPLDYVGRLALFLMAACQVEEPAELSIAFVGASLMQEMNQQYRGIDKATDILSFESGFDDDEQRSDSQPLALGDIVICPEAVEQGFYGEELDFISKLEVLVVHGILHLLSLDHENAQEADAMEAKEDALLGQWQAFYAGLPEENGVMPAAVRPNSSENANNKPAGSLKQSFKWAFSGIWEAVRTERNMKIHLVVALAALIASALLRLEALAWALVVLCIAFVWSTEMINTAIEHVVDLASPDIHPKAKSAKDIAAGVVLVSVIASVVIGLIVFVHALDWPGLW